MLTLREPIKLNIADDLTTVTDSFYERVVGNYSMMNASITPKDLLFFLSTPPEIPDDLGGMTTFAIQNSTTDNRSIAMDIVNNVVNRILLSETTSFTYQDQVYINNFLNKLGITDVSVFMKQVKQLTEEHKAVNELISLYSEELKLRESSPTHSEEIEVISGNTAAHRGSDERALPPLFMHSEIYKRLETDLIYDIVNSYQSDQSHIFGTFHNNEIKTAEQLSVSKLLTLSQLKEQAVSGGGLTLQHMTNRYELGDILPPPQNEDEVLTQAAEAAILATIEHAYVQKLYSKYEGNKHWLSLEQSLNATIENSISRFQSFHNDNIYFEYNAGDSSENTILQYKGEAQVLRELVRMRRELGTISKNSLNELSFYTQLPKLNFNQIQNEFSDINLLDIDSYAEYLTNRTENQISDTVREQILREKGIEPMTVKGSDILSSGGSALSHPIETIHPASDIIQPLTSEEIVILDQLKNMTAVSENTYLSEKLGDSLENVSSLNVNEVQVLRELINTYRQFSSSSVVIQKDQNTLIEALNLTYNRQYEYRTDIDSLDLVISENITNKTSNLISDTVREQILKEKDFDLKTIIKSDISSAGDLTAPPPVETVYNYSDEDKTLTPEEIQILEKQRSMQATKEIAEKTRSILSREIISKQAKPQIPESQPAPEILTHKTVREIELEYDIIESSKLLQDIVNRKIAIQPTVASETSVQEIKRETLSPVVQNVLEQKFFAEGNKSTQNVYRDDSRITLNQPTSSETPDTVPFISPSEVERISPESLVYHVSDREADPALLAREVDEIERRNRERFESINISRIEKTAEHLPVPDRAKTLNASLRALESPEAVMQELLSSPAPTKHPTSGVSPEAEVYLSNADEATRQIFEAVLRYEKNPEATRQEKLFHVGSIGEFNAATTLHAQTATPPQQDIIKQQREKTLHTERQETVLERFNELPSKHQTVKGEQELPPRVPIIHRQEQNQFSEELLERLEQQRNQVSTTQIITDEVSNRQVHEITQNEINTQVVTQNTEEITRLVNQTLAKQMNAISDKVYHQMEKRLQTERSRRGRF